MKRITHRYVRTILVVFLALAMCLTTLPLTGMAVYASDDGAPDIVTEETGASVNDQVDESETPDENELTDEDLSGSEGNLTDEEPGGTNPDPSGEGENGGSVEGGDSTGGTDGGSTTDDNGDSTTGDNGGSEGNEPPTGENIDPDTPTTGILQQEAPLNVTAVSYSGTYNAKSHTFRLKGVPKNATVKYSRNGTKWTTTKPKRTSAGTTKVWYRVKTPGGQTAKGTVKIVINQASLKSATLSSKSYTYNGKVKTPTVKAYGRVVSTALKGGRDYSVKYSLGRKKVGKYTVKITGKGNYKGTITRTFTIKPAKVSLKGKSLSCGSLNVRMNKKASAYGGGYFQIAYRRPGHSWRYTTTTSAAKDLYVPEANKYYVKVRVVKKSGGKTYKSDWSKTYKAVNWIPVRAQRVLRSANRTPFAGQGWCAAWVCDVFDRSGVLTSARMPYASDYYRHYCFSSNRADLKPGMIVASRYSYAGTYAGHIGIYIGNGKIISNETCITIKTVDEFAATYSHGYPIRWGWMNGKKLL